LIAPGKAAWWSILALVAGSFGARAQEQGESKDDLFWEVRQRQEAGSAAQLVLARNPWTIAVLRGEGLRWKVWREPEFVGDTVPALNPDWLDLVRDGTGMPNFRGVAEDEKRPDQIAIYNVWSEAVVNAFRTPADAFAKSAEENAHVTFAHLWSSPDQYRGKVVSIKGRLVRVRKYEATLAAQKVGVKYVYDGWIQGPTRGSYPFWVVFTNLPEGLKEAEEMNREVTFSGYFLKKMKYVAGDGSKFLQTPFLVGPTVILAREAPPAPPTTPISMTVVASVVVVIVAVSIGLVLLSWYFHRGDQALRKRLAQMQADRALGSMDQLASGDTGENARGLQS